MTSEWSRPHSFVGLVGGRWTLATLYVLTDLGRSLDEPLSALGRWVEANWDLVEAAQREWEDRTRS